MDKPPFSPEDLFTLTLAGDAQISPDGRRIAYVVKQLDREKNEYLSNIWLWENGQGRQYTAGDKDSTPRWSPDGRWLAFLSGREEKSQIFLIPTAGGEAIRLTDQKLGAGTPVWAPESSAIAFAGAVPLAEAPEEEDGKDKPAKTHVFERAVYKANGRGLIDDRRSHIFTVDIETRATVQLTDGDYFDAAPAWSPDSQHIAFHADRSPEWDLRSGSDIWIIPREGGTPRRLTDGQGHWTNPVFSPDGSRIAVVGFPKPDDEPRAARFPQLWVMPRGGGKLKNLMAGADLAVDGSVTTDWSAAGEEAVYWNENGIFFLAAERGTTNIYRWRDGLRRLTEGCHHIMDFSVTPRGRGEAIACTVADATHPAEIFRMEKREESSEKREARSEKREAASHSSLLTPHSSDTSHSSLLSPHFSAVSEHNAKLLAERCTVRPERVPFRGANDEEVDAWLMKPARFEEGRRYPLIIYIHGGPTAAYGESFFHEFQTLAAAGFGVLYCNPHGSTSYGCAFQESIVGDWGNLDYQDIMAALDLAAALPWVDERRIGVAGGSYGGFLTNWMISHTDRFAAACTERGICNHVSQGGTSDWASYRGERLGGTPEHDPEFLWERSPLKYVVNVKTPTLIVHSERDDRCPIEEAEQWFMALKRLRVPVRFVRFPEENHELSRSGKPSRRLERLEHIQSWFKERM